MQGFDRLFPGIRAHILTLRINFRTPFLREYLLLHGGLVLRLASVAFSRPFLRECLLLHGGRAVGERLPRFCCHDTCRCACCCSHG